jgi:hypothetical protein
LQHFQLQTTEELAALGLTMEPEKA